MLNEVKIIGYVGKNPVTSAEGKKPFAAFDVGYTTRYTPKNGESSEPIEKTQWFEVVCYGKQAEFVAKHISKGSHVLIIGSLENNLWTDKDDKNHRDTRILTNRKPILLDRKSENHDVAEEE